MIKRLRNRFIRIAMLSVTAVMMLLTIILNVANYVSTDSDLKQTLTLIYENAGTIPTRVSCRRAARTAPMHPRRRKMTAAAVTLPRAARRRRRFADAAGPPDDKIARREGPFTAETPFSTRFLSCTTHQAAR